MILPMSALNALGMFLARLASIAKATRSNLRKGVGVQSAVTSIEHMEGQGHYAWAGDTD